MKTTMMMTLPLLCLLSACSDEADAPVRDNDINAEMPPQPEIDEPLTEEEVDAVMDELEADDQALEEGISEDSAGDDNSSE